MPDSAHYGLMLNREAQLETDIGSGRITGVAVGSVDVKEVPITVEYLIDNAPKSMPGIILCPAQQGRESIAFDQGAGQARDEIGYPTLVFMIDADTDSSRLDFRSNLIDLVADRFREQRVAVSDPATSFHRCKITSPAISNHRRLRERKLWIAWFVATHYTFRLVPA